MKESFQDRYKKICQLSDYNPRNAFKIERYLSTRLKPKPDEVYDVFHLDSSKEAQAAR